MKKNVFLFDQNKCVGCHACVVACINENGFQKEGIWRNIHKSDDQHFPQLPLFYLSLACNHCDDAPCLKNCPALAYTRDEKTGAVIHNPEKCIGCKYCTWACPYDAPKFNPKTGIIEKCTFCNHRIDEGLKPACANLCPVGALDFASIDFSREESAESSPVPVDVGAHIEIKKIRKPSGPEMDVEIFKEQKVEKVERKKHSKVSAIEEWPLVIFTLLVSALVSVFISGLAEKFNALHKIIYLGFAGIAAMLSTLHLGKQFRAWRSITNIQNSWLSREIALFILFFAGVFIDFYIWDIPLLMLSFVGIILLYAIDMLYKIATWKWKVNFHHAQSIFIGITLFTFFTGYNLWFILLVSVRLMLELFRNFKSKRALVIWAVKIIFYGLSVYLLQSEIYYPSLILLAITEIIGRIEFYNDLRLPDPADEFGNYISK